MTRPSRAIAPLILLLIVTGFFWKLLTRQFTWMDSPDLVYQVLPWYQLQAVSWHHGVFPLWDPHIWGGQPLIGQLQPGSAYPLNWILFLLPLKEGRINPLWMNLSFIGAHFLAALYFYWLCRELKRSRPASILGGAAFALGGLVGSVGWPQVLNGMIWIPLVLLFYVRWLRTHQLRQAAWSGTFLGISFLSGHHQIPIFAGLMMVCLWLIQIWKRRALAAPALFALFTVLVSALQVLPAYEYGRHAVRFVGLPNAISWSQYVPYSVHEKDSLSPLGILGMILPDLSPQNIFLGLAVFTLAVVGFTARFRNPLVRMLGVIAVSALLIGLGGLSVFHGVAYLIVPTMEKASMPVMALVLVQLGISALAAYGLDALRMAAWKRWPVRTLIIAGILTLAILLILGSVRPETAREYQRLTVFGVVALALALTLRSWGSRRISYAAAVGLIFVVALFELGTVTGRNFTSTETPTFLGQLQKNQDVVEFLRNQPDFIRLEMDLANVPYNVGDWDGLDQFQGYLGGLTSNVLPLAGPDSAQAKVSPRLFALTHYIGPEPIRTEMKEVYRGKSGINVYRDPEAFPRAWTVHESEHVDVISPARLETADLRRKAFLTGQVPALETCSSPDDVRITERSVHNIQLQANMQCRGMVVLSETDYPGWHATVDGQSVPIYDAYGVLRAVVVDAGTHQIEMRYRPTSVYAGAFLTTSGLLAAIALVLIRPSPRLSPTQRD